MKHGNILQSHEPLWQWQFTTLLLLLLLISTQSVAADLKLSIDRTKVVAGETFTLTVERFDSITMTAPKPTKALHSALEILSGPSMEFSKTIINGKLDTQITWSWQILAQTQGQYKIPAFSDGKNTSNTLQVTVKKAPKSTSALNNTSLDDIIVSLEADTLNALVGEQIILSWKVMFKTNIRGNIQPSDLPASFESQMLEPIKGKDYVSTIQNTPYEVKEFRQAIYATESGSFTVPPIFFNGSYRPSNSHRSRYKNITLGSQPIQLEISPPPQPKQSTQKNQNKIPITEKLRITTQWSMPDDPIDIGEPITLETHLSAPGQLASRLPNIILPAPSGLKIYNDGEESREDSNWSIGITGYRTQKFAIIPQKPGRFTIPKTQIAWWNTQTKALEYTEVAGKTIQVKDSAGQFRAQNSVPITGIIDPEQAPDEIVNTINNAIAGTQNTNEEQVPLEDNKELWENLTYIFILLWLITAIYAYRSVQQRRQLKNSAHTTQHTRSKNTHSKNTNSHQTNPPVSQEQALQEQQQSSTDLSRKKVQLQIIPILELHPHDVPPQESCHQMVQLLCAWAGQEHQGITPKNLTQLIELIEEKDPWQPLLKECEGFLYSNTVQQWPQEAIRTALLQGLPQLQAVGNQKASSKHTIAPFTP